MQGVIQRFEKELKIKLQYKSTGIQSEEDILLRAFSSSCKTKRDFDWQNDERVDKDEFKIAMEKVGIMIPNNIERDQLFKYYDTDKNGVLYFREFTAKLYGQPYVGDRKGNFQIRSSEQLAEDFRAVLVKRGVKGFIGMKRSFNIMDDNKSGTLDMYEFTKGMVDYRLGFTEGEIQRLFDYFDYDKSGDIDYEEFIRAVRGPMKVGRKNIVNLAFEKLDKDGNGWIDIDEIRGLYTPKRHPDVVSNKKTEDQILQEFMATFEASHAMRNNNTPNYVVTKQEFEEYYNNISATIEDDAHFKLIIENAWQLTKEARKGLHTQGWTNQSASVAETMRQGNIFNRPYQAKPTKIAGAKAGIPINAAEEALLEKIKDIIRKRGIRGVTATQKKFIIADWNKSGTLDLKEFESCAQDMRLGLSKREVLQAFHIFDRNGDGEIDYQEFTSTLRGEMGSTRKAVAVQAFKKMDKFDCDVIDINLIRQSYATSQHPNVVSGKQTEDQVVAEFLDTFELHHNNVKGTYDCREGQVTLLEWLEYFNMVSMTIDKDEFFTVMMHNAWNLGEPIYQKKAWQAGKEEVHQVQRRYDQKGRLTRFNY